MTIWKFPLEVTHFQEISAPADWRPLSVQFQGGILCLWAIVEHNPKLNWQTYAVRIHGTGHPFVTISEPFLGTVQDGSLVWHVFAEEARR